MSKLDDFYAIKDTISYLKKGRVILRIVPEQVECSHDNPQGPSNATLAVRRAIKYRGCAIYLAEKARDYTVRKLEEDLVTLADELGDTAVEILSLTEVQ